MIETALEHLTNNQDLDSKMAQAVIDEMMTGQTSDIQIAAYLAALSTKGESIAEITGSARAMRQHALPITTHRPVMDIVGTGGDQSGTFNISTTTSFVVTAAGVPVAKHGNNAATSKSGAADVLSALGAKIDLQPEQVEKLLHQTDQAFLYARTYHQAMKYVAPVRHGLGIKTIFNILGPLTNPANPQTMLLGAYDKALLVPLARVLHNLGVQHALLVHGQDGLDEVSLSADTDIVELKDGQITEMTLVPEDYGFAKVPLSDLKGGTPSENAEITREILNGNCQDAKRQIVILNAGCALYAANYVDDILAGIQLAQETIDDGRAFEQLTQFIQATQEV